MALDTQQIKSRLVEEKNRLESELSKIATRNKDGKSTDWQPIMPDLNSGISNSPEDMADKFEEMQNTVAAEVELENRLAKITGAIERISKGTYGTCSVCGKEIDPLRLEADPTAATCMEHARN